MRNLKKILAMALALIMSLSLMATAGAADFTDASSINDTYETAVEVLSGLGVFNGYKEDGSFRPQGSITRAETAAIIYRIVTGDVEDKQVSIYADYNIFTDVPSTSWFAGYVNFCANAEYIKGIGNDKFDPQGKVTGYAALAMILRAIGYTANGGFTGSDWEVQTARTAESRKITKNINTGTLGQPATRETVAEILFQAILVNMVDHNVLNTQNGNQGYFEKDESLGYKTFKLEQIEGIVMANEYANLDTNRVLGNDKTNLLVDGEETARTLAIGTKITDIGESRYAYVTGSKVLAMGDTGKNKVTETGAAVDISSASKFAATAEMPAAADIEYYTNFDINLAGEQYCNQRLEFSVTFYGAAAENAFDGYKGINLSKIAADDDEWSVEVTDKAGFVKANLNLNATDYTAGNTTPAYEYPVRYTKIIWAGQNISDTDLLVLESIFGTADNANNNILADKRITGDVFVGTKSTNNNVTDEERDLSNTISYKKFVEDYIISNTEDDNWNITWNGWWTKFVDNDGDGACEYAFRTNYSLEKALYTYTDRDGNTYIEFNDFDDENDSVRYLDGYTPAVGDKVLAAYIDGQYLVEPAKSEAVTVSSYSWRNDEITTDKGTYGQSGITNATDMMELISTMDDKVEYIVYFDHFGYVRAYELPGGTQYALITEMYYTNGNQGNLVDNWPMTAELTTLDSEGKTVTDEYNIVNNDGTFTAKQPWMRVENAVATYNYNNWLQPAIAHLGVTRTSYAPTKGTPTFVAPDVNSGDDRNPAAYATFWDANRQLVRDIQDNGMTGLEEFNYGAQNWTLNANKGYTWDVDETASFTNVAVVNIDGDNARLTGAATLNLNKTTGQPVAAPTAPEAYATDYVQLSIGDIAAQAVRYPIYDDGGTYQADNNYYVNAVHDTQYFIAYNGGVVSFKDYVNFPGLTVKANQIHAAYAVVRNTNSDLANEPYWVADVIVYEIYDMDDTAQTSVSLAFYTPTRTSGNVQEIETLNSKYGPEVTLIPGEKAWSADRGQWGVQWDGYGFYGLNNDTEPVDNVMTARSITKLGIGDYAKNNVHAGIITREAYIDGAGEYIDVSLGNGKSVSIEITNKIYSVTTGNGQSNRFYDINYADQLRYENQTNSQVRKGDSVIWVGDAKTNGTKSSTSFVVDLGSVTNWSNVTSAYCGEDLLADTASFLIGLVRDVNGNIVRDANGQIQILSYTSGVTNSSGVWQQIMNEQYVPVTYTLTATYTDGTDPVTGATAPVLETTSVPAGKDTPTELVFSNTATNMVTSVKVTSKNSDNKDTAEAYMLADGKWYVNNVTANTTLEVTVAPASYDVTLDDSGITNTAVASVVENPGSNDIKTALGTGAVKVAGGHTVVLTVTPDAGYTYVVEVNDTEIAPDAANGHVYTITVDQNIDIVITEEAIPAKDDVKTLATVTVDGDNVTVADTMTIDDLDFGTTEVDLALTLTSDKSSVEVWKGAVLFGTEITATDDVYTLDVPGTYVIRVTAEDDTTKDYTLTLAAVGASDVTTLTAAANSGIVIDNTDGSEKITLPAGASGVITVGRLKELVSGNNGATLKVVLSADSTVQDDTTVINATTMKVVVTAQNNDTQDYTIAFATP